MPEETGTTFEDNAKIKSESGFIKTGIPTLAEDSGLEIDALHGAPGIYSARYAQTPQKAIERVLNEMNNIKKRKARFVCVTSFTDNTGTHIFKGVLEGEIANEQKGSGGFGYDPIFLYDENHTTAQLSTEEKDAISHRGKALRAFKEWIYDKG